MALQVVMMWRKYSRPPSASLRRAVSSFRSWPAQKAGPLAASTTARTRLSAASSVQAAASAFKQVFRQAVAGARPVERHNGDLAVALAA